MARKVLRTGQAREDSLSIWRAIALDHPASADRVIAALELTYQSLAEMPHRTRVENRDVFRTTAQGFRQYVILYKFDEVEVKILRVFRADLDWTREIEKI